MDSSLTDTAAGRSASSAPAAGRALLAVNPKSRRGQSAIDSVRAILRGAGLELVEPGPAEDLSDLIRGHAGQVDRVIVGGGDGSMRAAAAGLLETGLPLGILPLGTGNDLARTLAIPPDPVRAAEIIAAGRRRRIDLGQVNDQYFFNVASIGLSVALTRALSSEDKRRLGRLAYLKALARVLTEVRRFGVEITAGSQRRVARTIQVAVGNGRFYGGGNVVEPSATIDDSLLALYSIETKHWWSLLRLLPWLRSGTHGSARYVYTLTAPAIEIRTRRPRPVNTDGDITTTTPARFSVLPAAITVFAP